MSGRKAFGFTLVELLAVIAIILILVLLVIGGLGPAMERGRTVICRSNIRQLQVGIGQLAVDSEGQLPSGATNPNAGYGKPWAEAHDFASANSAVWPYIREERVYACPSYPRPGRDYLKRHYSVSGFINSEGPHWGARYRAVSLSQVKNHARTHVIIEEYDHRSDKPTNWPRPGSQGSFVIGYGENGRYLNNWVDCPMFWHDWGAFFSFLDGHVEYRKWVGPRIRTVNIYTWRHVSEGRNWPSNPLDKQDFDYVLGGVTNGYVDQ